MVQWVVASWKSISAEDILPLVALPLQTQMLFIARETLGWQVIHILLYTNYTILMQEEDQHDVHVDSDSAYDDFSDCECDIDID